MALNAGTRNSTRSPVFSDFKLGHSRVVRSRPLVKGNEDAGYEGGNVIYTGPPDPLFSVRPRAPGVVDVIRLLARVNPVNIFFYTVFQVLIAVQPQAQMQYFDVEAKTWKPLASTIPPIEATQCHCAVSVGSRLFLTGWDSLSTCMFQYDTERNVWERLSHSCGVVNNLFVIDDHMYAISAHLNQVPQRYSFSKRQWQSITPVGTTGYSYYASKNGAIVLSKIFVLCENRCKNQYGYQPAVLNCFDPVKNEWEVKATTCQPHLGSSLIVVNNTLYVAGGRVSISQNIPSGGPAPVEMYNKESNTWSVVEQKHIPANNLGAVEIEGRVYFIKNNFPIDSGIRIPPGSCTLFL